MYKCDNSKIKQLYQKSNYINIKKNYPKTKVILDLKIVA